MAKTIPQLTDATTVNAADELIIQQGGITKRATGAELAKGLNTINGTVNVQDFGTVGDGVADDTAAIQAAIDYAESFGGGFALRLPIGQYKITSTLTINKANIVLAGAGGDQPHDAGSGVSAATKFLWYGAAGGTVVEFKTPYGVSHSKIGGVGLTDLTIDCRGIAAIGLRLDSVYGGIFRRIYVRDATQNAYYVTCGVTGTDIPEAADTQFCSFDNCTFRLIDSVGVQSANGFFLTGSSNANTSINRFEYCGGQHINGTAFLLENADNNVFVRCSGFRPSGTGYGFDFKAPTSGGFVGGDSNHLFNCGWPATNGAIVRATADGASHRNTFYGFDNLNGSQTPVFESSGGNTARGFWLGDNGIGAGLSMAGLALGDDGSTAVSARNQITNEPLYVLTGSGRGLVIKDPSVLWSIGTNAAGLLRIIPATASSVEIWGDTNIFGSNVLKVNGTQVVGARKTGWAAPTGTATRTTFATTTVTTEQLAERVKGLVDDLTSHGLIGT
jgi:hypothetical protein